MLAQSVDYLSCWFDLDNFALAPAWLAESTKPCLHSCSGIRPADAYRIMEIFCLPSLERSLCLQRSTLKSCTLAGRPSLATLEVDKHPQAVICMFSAREFCKASGTRVPWITHIFALVLELNALKNNNNKQSNCVKQSEQKIKCSSLIWGQWAHPWTREAPCLAPAVGQLKGWSGVVKLLGLYTVLAL